MTCLTTWHSSSILNIIHAVISKEDILKISRELIRQQGWPALNIRSVAAACGVEEELFMKRYINAALLYAALAMAGGVFYREFTKFNGYTAKTALSVVHTHYFLLGMAFFLLLLLLEKGFSFTGAKTRRVLTVYHIGLNLTAVMLVVRGVTQVVLPTISSGLSAAISGIAGIGHILLGVSMLMLLAEIKGSVSAAQR